MPTFLLVPRDEATDDPDWEASLHFGPCLVVAADERAARRYADGAFCRAVMERRPDRPDLPSSPWSQPRLVRATVVRSPIRGMDEAQCEGMVRVPVGDPVGKARRRADLPAA